MTVETIPPFTYSHQLNDGLNAEELSQEDIEDDEPVIFTDLSVPAEIDVFSPNHHISGFFYIARAELFKTEKPYFMNVPVTDMKGLKQSNVIHTRRQVAITDIRGHEDLFLLDKNGFQVGELNTELHYDDFSIPEKIVDTYYEECRQLLKKTTGAKFVLPFDYQVRRRDPQKQAANSRGEPGKAQPFGAVHADQTKKSAMRRLHYFHPEEAENYKDYRAQIINIWKPLRGPVYDAPLTVCDYQTVPFTDRVPTDIIFPDYLGETYNFYPNSRHRWYFIDGQMANEALMVKCFDSKTAEDETVAQFAPHVSFPYSNQPKDAQLRQSIEVRNFVFSKKE